jgi:hypothetical protein
VSVRFDAKKDDIQLCVCGFLLAPLRFRAGELAACAEIFSLLFFFFFFFFLARLLFVCLFVCLLKEGKRGEAGL